MLQQTLQKTALTSGLMYTQGRHNGRLATDSPQDTQRTWALNAETAIVDDERRGSDPFPAVPTSASALHHDEGSPIAVAPLPAPACSPRSLRRQSEPPTVSALRGQFEAERPTVVPSASAPRNLRRHATAGSIPISSSHL